MAQPVWAQDSEDTGQESSEASSPEPTEAAEETTAEPVDDVDDLLEPYPEEDNDVFIPSEDVKFGQSIPFPTDI
jgi:hypothetical protein